MAKKKKATKKRAKPKTNEEKYDTDDMVKRALTKIIVGVMNGAKLSNTECIVIARHIQKMERLLETAKEMLDGDLG